MSDMLVFGSSPNWSDALAWDNNRCSGPLLSDCDMHLGRSLAKFNGKKVVWSERAHYSELVCPKCINSTSLQRGAGITVHSAPAFAMLGSHVIQAAQGSSLLVETGGVPGLAR